MVLRRSRQLLHPRRLILVVFGHDDPLGALVVQTWFSFLLVRCSFSWGCTWVSLPHAPIPDIVGCDSRIFKSMHLGLLN